MVANLCRSSNCEYERLANVPFQSMDDLFEIVVHQLLVDINTGTMYLGANTVMYTFTYTIFFVVKLDLYILALLLDHILAREKNYAYTSRTSCLQIGSVWALYWLS